MDPIPEEAEVCEAVGSPALHNFATVFTQPGTCTGVRVFVSNNLVQWHEGPFDPFFESIDIDKLSLTQKLKRYLSDVFEWVGTNDASRFDT